MYFCSKKVRFPSLRSAFFKIPSNQKFEYRTRFYDQEKELRKERLAQLKEKEGTIYASGVHTLRGKFRQARTDRQRMQSQSSYRVIILAAMLFLTMFLFIYQIDLFYVIPILIVLAVLLFKFSKRI